MVEAPFRVMSGRRPREPEEALRQAVVELYRAQAEYATSFDVWARAGDVAAINDAERRIEQARRQASIVQADFQE